MKYKVLINGRNSALVADFIQHTDAFFNTLSTSEYWQDILGHFKVFEPDAYVCFVEPEYEKTINQINSLKTSGYYNGAAIILIGDAVTCRLIEENARFSADVIIRRPVTPDNITLRITRYFDDINEAREKFKEKELARQAEEEAKYAALEAKAAETAKAIEAKAAKAAAKENEAKAADAANDEKKHILIVDDDRTVLKLLKTALGDEYDVTTMINGVMIEKFLDAKPVDLIILDYEMPIETGADIFKRLKKNPKAIRIPVCFLTGVSDREKIMEVMSLKPDGYLLKPIDMDMLSATIRNLTN